MQQKRKQNNTKFKGKSSNRTKYDDSKERKQNDVTWYTRESQLARDSGRIAFTWPLGNKINYDLKVDQAFSAESTINSHPFSAQRLPGVMALPFAPTLGNTSDNTGVINIAARNLYSWVRHANSGHANYDAPDLMMYLLAMDSAYTLYAHMARAYGTLMFYSALNRNVPEMLVNAMEFDFDDLRTNMADFRFFINQYAVKVGSFCVPAEITYFTRHVWLASHIYADAPSVKSQFYLFRPYVYSKYVETQGMGHLQCVFPSSKMKFSDLITMANEILDPIVESEDFNIMSGDILKAYGSDKLISLAQIAENYTVVPEYSEEVLYQIKNATILESVAYENSRVVEQTANGYLKSRMVIRSSTTLMDGRRLMVSKSDTPSEDEVIINSRLMVTGTYNLNETAKAGNTDFYIYELEPDSLGSEVIVGAQLYHYAADGSIDSHRVSYNMSVLDVDTKTITSEIVPMLTLAESDYFAFHPYVSFCARRTEVDAQSHIYHWAAMPHYDVDNYALLGSQEVAKLHETALLSMFAVQQYGRTTAK